MTRYLSWDEVERRMDEVQANDPSGIVAVFLEFEGLPLDMFDGRGARSNVNVSTFSHRFGLRRHTLSNWLTRYGTRRAG